MSRRERMALLEPVVAPPTILHCSRCVSDLPVSEFTPQSNKKRGYQAWCKPCYAMYQRESKYGLSRDAIMEMLSGGCEGCGSIDNLCIDHCHATGVVRGVLCDGCNTAYGLLRDNALVVAGLLAYALKHGGAK